MFPTHVTLKNGKTITVRNALPSDASDLIALKLEYLEGSQTIPLFTWEYDNTIEDEKKLIQRLTNEKNSILLVAEHNGELVGNIDLNGNQRAKLFHTGVIGMGVRKEWQGKGVGSVLLSSVIFWSNQNPHLNLLWLEVYETNDRGLHLYQKMGFNRCGKMNSFFKEEEKYIDKITMIKHL